MTVQINTGAGDGRGIGDDKRRAYACGDFGAVCVRGFELDEPEAYVVVWIHGGLQSCMRGDALAVCLSTGCSRKVKLSADGDVTWKRAHVTQIRTRKVSIPGLFIACVGGSMICTSAWRINNLIGK